MRDIAWVQSLIMVKTIQQIEVLEVHAIAVEAGLTFYDVSYVWLARSMSLIFCTKGSANIEYL